MATKAGRAKVVAEEENVRGEVPFEAIATRAYEIHLSGTGADELGDWLQAETELNARVHADPEIETEVDV